MVIVRNDNMNISQIVQKWTPVLEQIFNRDGNRGFDYYTDEQIQEIARYCEYHSISEISNNGQVISGAPNMNGGSSAPTTMLPIAVSIIAKLNLEGKKIFAIGAPNFDVTEENEDGEAIVKNLRVKTMEVNVTFSREEAMSLSEEHYESILMERMVSKLNLQLKYYDTIVVYLAAQRVSVISEATMSPKVFLRSRLLFMDRNEEEEAMYRIEKDRNGVVTNIEYLDVDSENYVRTSAEPDGRRFWINVEENTVITDVYTEEEALKMIDSYEKIINDSKRSLDKLRELLN